MSEKVTFKYFEGRDVEQFTFYRIPKQLFTVSYFKGLSSDAKILYGLMLDRISLSLKNQWFDENNRAYIYFSIEDVMEMLGCGKNKAVKCMKELDVETGIGLTQKRRQGFGKSNMIYVKTFLVEGHAGIRQEELDGTADQKQTSVKAKERNIKVEESDKRQGMETIAGREMTELPVKSLENPEIREKEDLYEELELQNSFPEKFDKQTIGENRPDTGVYKANFKKFTYKTSRIPDNKLLEVCFGESNNTYKSNTEYSYNKSNLISSSRDINLAANQNDEMRCAHNNTLSSHDSPSGVRADMGNRHAMIESYRKVIRQNIDYDFLLSDPTIDQSLVQEIYELIVETVLCLGKEIVIASNRYPAEIVRSRFMRLNYMHIRYVLECLEKNTTKVKNIRKYLLATLFNAPATMDGYYRAEVNHDLPRLAGYGEG